MNYVPAMPPQYPGKAGVRGTAPEPEWGPSGKIKALLNVGSERNFGEQLAIICRVFFFSRRGHWARVLLWLPKGFGDWTCAAAGVPGGGGNLPSNDFLEAFVWKRVPLRAPPRTILLITRNLKKWTVVVVPGEAAGPGFSLSSPRGLGIGLARSHVWATPPSNDFIED